MGRLGKGLGAFHWPGVKLPVPNSVLSAWILHSCVPGEWVSGIKRSLRVKLPPKSTLIQFEHRHELRQTARSQLLCFVCSRQSCPGGWSVSLLSNGKHRAYFPQKSVEHSHGSYTVLWDSSSLDLHLQNQKAGFLCESTTCFVPEWAWFHSAVLRVGSEGPRLGRAAGWSLGSPSR